MGNTISVTMPLARPAGAPCPMPLSGVPARVEGSVVRAPRGTFLGTRLRRSGVGGPISGGALVVEPAYLPTHAESMVDAAELVVDVFRGPSAWSPPV